LTSDSAGLKVRVAGLEGGRGGPWGDSSGHQIGQSSGALRKSRLQGAFSTIRRAIAGKALVLAVGIDQIGQLVSLRRSISSGGRFPALGSNAQSKGAIGARAETPLGYDFSLFGLPRQAASIRSLHRPGR